MSARPGEDSARIEAVVLDLDGVVTDTAKLHERAWREALEPVLSARGERAVSHADYLAYIDGKPRLDGARSFLASRHIALDDGAPDEPGDTVFGVAHRKNARFRALLDDPGVEVFADAVTAIQAWRDAGLGTALVSSSRNARRVVQAAGLDPLFDVVVDGQTGASEGLAGKPAADYFLRAAEALGVAPERAVVLEDAVSGVAAGARGHFGRVVGVARNGNARELLAHGADEVVAELTEPSLDGLGAKEPRRLADRVPRLLDHLDAFVERLRASEPWYFFDFDGTLTPIVERPDDAVLDDATRRALEKLARKSSVAIVSGRDLHDLRDRVGLEALAYAGSHGFEVSAPHLAFEHEAVTRAKPELAVARERLAARLADVPGVVLEPKNAGLAVHFRGVADEDIAGVLDAVREALGRARHLRLSRGKKVVELLPDARWDKGRAIAYLIEHLHAGALDGAPIYVGDDLTDEDAFAEVADRGGVAILVGDHGEPTRAHYRLENVDEVRALLRTLGAPHETSAARDAATWCLVYDGYEPSAQPLREALCTLGNGKLATRGAAEEESARGPHYPGTYVAGGYDRQRTYLAERWIESEDLVNFPNWLPLSFRIEGGDWVSLDAAEVLSFRQELDVRCGVLTRAFRIRDAADRETELTSRRIVSMRDPSHCAEAWTLVPRNWTGRVTVRSSLDASVENAGVPRYAALESRHFAVVEVGAAREDVVHLTVQTLQSKLRMSQAARTSVFFDGVVTPVERALIEEPERVGHDLSFDAALGRPIVVEKVVAIFTSRDRAIADTLSAAIAGAERAPRFDALVRANGEAWAELWSRFHFDLVGPSPRVKQIARLHVFHLLESVSPHTIDLDVGVTSRGLHGEAYRGHVFWDELFIFPLLNLRIPELTRALLRYRHRRLPAARRAARDAGYAGAMFPWQSGSDGREESQEMHLNPESGRWLPDETHLQRHIGSAIAYNVWQYFLATHDRELLAFYGAEMVLEIAAFWASIATLGDDGERYHIRGVVGPDEFHTRYPGATDAGVDDNAYTNAMAAWTLRSVRWVLDELAPDRMAEVLRLVGMTHDDLARFDDVSRRMYIPFLDRDRGLLAQYEGYGDLEELDWDVYRERHGDIGRLDRLLEAEGDSVNAYKASKQADVLMLFYLFSAEELASLFAHLGYAFDPAMIPNNVAYYTSRTTHGSSLSRVASAWVLARGDRERSWALFEEALESDLHDIQGGTTREGIHLGAMSGTVDLLQRCYAGVEIRDEGLWINPRLPPELDRLKLGVRYRGHWLELDISCREITVSAAPGFGQPLEVGVCDQVWVISPGESRRVAIDARR